MPAGRPGSGVQNRGRRRLPGPAPSQPTGRGGADGAQAGSAVAPRGVRPGRAQRPATADRGDRQAPVRVKTAIWMDPGNDRTNIDRARELWSAVQPFSTGGVYVNNLGDVRPMPHRGPEGWR